jgi:hypothetical protein
MAGYREDPQDGPKGNRFLRAVIAGTAVAALIPFALVAAMLLSGALSEAGLGELVFVGFVALAIPLTFVLVASTFIGLPIVALLRAIGRESAWAYVSLGLLAGAAVMLAIFGTSGWLLPAGAIAGGVTAYAWWRNRAVDRDA